MKWYKYKVLLLENADTEEKTFLDKAMTYNEANLPIVQKEAYNGEYTIEDDGQPEPDVTPSQMDVIEAQVTYTAMMTDTLLEV